MTKMLDSLIKVIEQQPELFSDETRQDLIEQSPTWSDEPKELNNSAGKWLRANPDIRAAAMKNLSSKEQERRLFGKTSLSTSDIQTPEIKPEDYKEVLLNAIHRNFGVPMATVANDNY